MATSLLAAKTRQSAALSTSHLETSSYGEPLTTVPDFERFGQWGERVSVARDGTIHQLAHWLATQPDRQDHSTDEFWHRCRQANQACFREYAIVTLDAPSFFLPQGEVVFSVVENPVQLPDHPPQGVIMRHLEAMTHYPLARFYLLEPVFTFEPQLRLYTADELREEAAGDRRVAEQIARRFGWAHRWADWTKARGRDLAAHTLRGAAWVVEHLARELGPRHMEARPHIDEWSALLADETLDRLARRADESGLRKDAIRLRRAIEELRWRTSIDPVLVFELEERPGELWFESHWFTGADGRRYVHY